MNGKPYYSVREVCDMLGMPKTDGLLKLIHAGELRAVNISTGPCKPTWRISREALDQFIQARTCAPVVKPLRTRRANAGKATQYF